MFYRFLAVLSLVVVAPANAAPNVAVDIAPVHSLVALVMGDVATPALVIPQGASAHGHALRPSEARALAQADLVVSIGPQLSPAFDRAREKIGSDAVSLTLLDVDGTFLLEIREDASFQAHEDDHASEGHDHHDEVDPHAWLDPHNARTWLVSIADALAALDAENQEIYRQNAREAVAALSTLEQDINDALAPVRGRPFVVQHDAYHYFEHRFDIEATGALAASDAAPPGPARVREVQNMMEELGVVCVFSETEADAVRVRELAGDAATVAIIDPLGSAIAPGPDLYATLLTQIADTMGDCL